MGKPKRGRSLKDTEAMAVGRNLRGSSQKLNLVAQAIRGKTAGAALSELRFSKRRVAGAVKKVLESAVANAENNHQLDVDLLYVAEASVGKGMVIKRWRPRARGRMGRIVKPWSTLTVIVREREGQA